MLAALYREYGFTRWLDEIEPDAGTDSPVSPVADADYECVLTPEAFDAWLERLQSAGEFAIDTETTSIDYMKARLVGISLCVETGKACYIPARA